MITPLRDLASCERLQIWGTKLECYEERDQLTPPQVNTLLPFWPGLPPSTTTMFKLRKQKQVCSEIAVVLWNWQVRGGNDPWHGEMLFPNRCKFTNRSREKLSWSNCTLCKLHKQQTPIVKRPSSTCTVSWVSRWVMVLSSSHVSFYPWQQFEWKTTMNTEFIIITSEKCRKCYFGSNFSSNFFSSAALASLSFLIAAIVS